MLYNLILWFSPKSPFAVQNKSEWTRQEGNGIPGHSWLESTLRENPLRSWNFGWFSPFLSFGIHSFTSDTPKTYFHSLAFNPTETWFHSVFYWYFVGFFYALFDLFFILALCFNCSCCFINKVDDFLSFWSFSKASLLPLIRLASKTLASSGFGP